MRSCFKLSAFQLNLLLLSQISMCRNFGYLKIAFQSQIFKSIQIMFVMSKLQIKSINNWFCIFNSLYFEALMVFLTSMTSSQLKENCLKIRTRPTTHHSVYIPPSLITNAYSTSHFLHVFTYIFSVLYRVLIMMTTYKFQ